DIPRFRPCRLHHRSDHRRQRRRPHALKSTPSTAAHQRCRSTEIITMTNDTIHDVGADRIREIREIDHNTRDAPDADFVEQMRRRFPSEAEYDRMLTRKAEHRADPRQAPSTL